MTYVLILSFLFGMAHALEADHLATVISFSVRRCSPREVLKQGLSWGLGHTITLFLVVVPLLLIGGTISARVESALEAFVGCTLVFLGGRLIWRIRRERVHIHVHSHADKKRHVHVHSHRHECGGHLTSPHDHEHRRHLSVRSLLVGLLHGLAGSAALLVYVGGAIETKWLAAPLVLLFGLGSIVGMAVVSQVIAVPLRHASGRNTRALQGVQCLAAAAAIAIGAVIMLGSLNTLLV